MINAVREGWEDTTMIVLRTCRSTIFAFAALVAWPATTLGHTLTNGTITIKLGDSSQGYTSANVDRVDGLQWVGSNATFSNYIANGGPLHCSDPQEFFGQSYATAGDERPYLVIAGTLSAWSGTGVLTGASHVVSLADCGTNLDGLTTTSYTLFNKGSLHNALRIIRTLRFRTLFSRGDVRIYVPRLPSSAYPFVLAPDTNGVVQTYNSGSCSGGCALTNWNGTWFADDDGHGNGIVMLRSPSHNKPAYVGIDNDSFSASNNTAVVLSLPAGGWTGRYTETEFMCFYDSASWPAAARNAGKLPAGCTAVSIK